MAENGLRERDGPGGTRLRPIYTLRFSYPEGWEILFRGPTGGEGATEERHFYFAEGKCEGEVRGKFRGANHPHRRIDRTFEMDMHGLIETEDGATIMVDYRGYGRVHKATDGEGRRQVVGAAWHFADSERYRWLNDSVCAVSGEVRAPQQPPGKVRQGDVKLVFDVAEIVWERPQE